jgi:hypothetical protein
MNELTQPPQHPLCPHCGVEVDGSYCPRCGVTIRGNVIRVEGHVAAEVLEVATKLTETHHKGLRVPRHPIRDRADRLVGFGGVVVAAGAAMTATATNAVRWIGVGVLAFGVVLAALGFFAVSSSR